MLSIDFDELYNYQHSDQWDAADQMMVDAAQRLERGGADCVLICANTMHKSAPHILAAVSIPLLHIADAAGEAVQRAGLTRVGLLGTRYTMEGNFITGPLTQKYGLDVLIPNDDERPIINDVIYGELVHGVIREESRRAYQQVIAALVERGAQGIILGCTEIPLLIKPEHSPVPVFDTTLLHATAAVDFALGVSEPSGA